MKRFVLIAAFTLLAGSASAQFESYGGLSRGLANALYCQLSGGANCTMTGAISFSGSGKLASAFPIAIGTGTAVGNLSGNYAKFVSAAGVGNGADATDDALWTLASVPSNAFTANGDAIFLVLTVKAAATANSKRWGLTVGGTQVNTSSTTANNLFGVLTATITRVDATHVNVAITGVVGNVTVAGGSLNLVVSDLTANTLALVATGQSGTSTAGDALLISGFAEFKK